MLMYQKSMFDRYYCKKKQQKKKQQHFFRSKTLEKLLLKVPFTCTYNGAETEHVTYKSFENIASRTKPNVIATVHFTDDDSFL